MRRGEEKGPSPSCSLLGSGSLRRLRPCSSTGCGAGGAGEEPVEHPLCQGQGEHPPRDLVLLAALDLGFEHLQELGRE